jgi:hypothetical protein
MEKSNTYIILDWRKSIKQYIKVVDEGRLRFKDLRCPYDKIRSVIGWGWYERSCIYEEERCKVRIKRCLCKLCKRTFSLLPSFLIRGCMYAIGFVKRLRDIMEREGLSLQKVLFRPEAYVMRDESILISPNTLRRYILRLKELFSADRESKPTYLRVLPKIIS